MTSRTMLMTCKRFAAIIFGFFVVFCTSKWSVVVGENAFCTMNKTGVVKVGGLPAILRCTLDAGTPVIVRKQARNKTKMTRNISRVSSKTIELKIESRPENWGDYSCIDSTSGRNVIINKIKSGAKTCRTTITFYFGELMGLPDNFKIRWIDGRDMKGSFTPSMEELCQKTYLYGFMNCHLNLTIRLAFGQSVKCMFLSNQSKKLCTRENMECCTNNSQFTAKVLTSSIPHFEVIAWNVLGNSQKKWTISDNFEILEPIKMSSLTKKVMSINSTAIRLTLPVEGLYNLKYKITLQDLENGALISQTIFTENNSIIFSNISPLTPFWKYRITISRSFINRSYKVSRFSEPLVQDVRTEKAIPGPPNWPQGWIAVWPGSIRIWWKPLKRRMWHSEAISYEISIPEFNWNETTNSTTYKLPDEQYVKIMQSKSKVLVKLATKNKLGKNSGKLFGHYLKVDNKKFSQPYFEVFYVNPTTYNVYVYAYDVPIYDWTTGVYASAFVCDSADCNNLSEFKKLILNSSDRAQKITVKISKTVTSPWFSASWQLRGNNLSQEMFSGLSQITDCVYGRGGIKKALRNFKITTTDASKTFAEFEHMKCDELNYSPVEKYEIIYGVEGEPSKTMQVTKEECLKKKVCRKKLKYIESGIQYKVKVAAVLQNGDREIVLETKYNTLAIDKTYIGVILGVILVVIFVAVIGGIFCWKQYKKCTSKNKVSKAEPLPDISAAPERDVESSSQHSNEELRQYTETEPMLTESVQTTTTAAASAASAAEITSTTTTATDTTPDFSSTSDTQGNYAKVELSDYKDTLGSYGGSLDEINGENRGQISGYPSSLDEINGENLDQISGYPNSLDSANGGIPSQTSDSLNNSNRTTDENHSTAFRS